MRQSQNADDVLFPPGEMIAASELREFVYCERAWFLRRAGYTVSQKAQAHARRVLRFMIS